MYPEEGTTAFAREALTVDNTSGGVTLTSATYMPSNAPPATRAKLRLETGQIRYTSEGTAPTSSLGTLMEIGDVLILTGLASLNQFKAIRTGSTSGTLQCVYER